MSAAGRVVLVHGLWMHGFVFGVLRHRLERDFGFEVSAFSYPTLHGDIDRVVSDLAEFGAAAGDGPVHFVGHSLGGVLVYRALERFPQNAFGNAVVLGSPLGGSRAARSASQWPVLRPLLGSRRGLAFAQALLPAYSAIDAYHMAACSIEIGRAHV